MEPFKAVNTWLGKQYHLFIFLKRRAVPKVTAGTPGSADIAATLPRLPISGPLPLREMSLEHGSEKTWSSTPSLSGFEPTILKQRSHAQWPELRMPKATKTRARHFLWLRLTTLTTCLFWSNLQKQKKKQKLFVGCQNELGARKNRMTSWFNLIRETLVREIATATEK